MNAPVVQVKEGKLKGYLAKNVNGGEYIAFDGIPFAQPPIGDLRFKEPQNPKPWDGVRDATKPGPKAAQYDMWFNQNSNDEDCLYLNVATNSLTGKKPVMVWIHGGAFLIGGPHYDLYSPDHLVRHDIVFVSIAYRLACFGFLNLDIPEASGNQGLKDQVAALKWVRENIHAFGGDPNNVTIFGESAGSSSVHLLTLSPLAKGLFHKAIAQSGVCLNPWAYEKNPVEFALEFTEHCGKSTKDPREAWKFLMTVPTEKLLETLKEMKIGSMDFQLYFKFVPSVDYKSERPFMPESPYVLGKRGVDVPLLLGYTSDEGLLVLCKPNIEKFFPRTIAEFSDFLARDMNFPDKERVRKIASDVKNHYFGKDELSLKDRKMKWSNLKGDIIFINGIQAVAEVQMNGTTPTYLYRFSYIPNYPTHGSMMKTDLEGACHGDDLGALFHVRMFMKDEIYKEGTRDWLTLQRMTRMWTNFAKTGNPTPHVDEIIPCKWEPLKKGEKNYLDIGDDLVPGKNPDHESWEFWKRVLEKLQ